jgi:hypothetical protein
LGSWSADLIRRQAIVRKQSRGSEKNL